jgi:hypothetical protein
LEVAGTDAESQLDFMAMAAGNPKVYSWFEHIWKALIW